MEAQSHLVAAPGLVPTSPFQAGTYPSPHFPSILFYTNFSLSLSETAGHFLNNALFVSAPRRRLRGVFQAEKLRLYPQIFLVQLIGPRSPNGPAGKQRKVKMLSRAQCCTTPGGTMHRLHHPLALHSAQATQLYTVPWGGDLGLVLKLQGGG